MRLKPVPKARGLDFLANAKAALPIVPVSERDAVTRLAERTAVPDDGAARELLTFLRALGLVERADGDFVRADRDVSGAALREPFRENVFGAREALDALDEGPKTEAEVFEALAERISTWERGRHADWERTWRERTRNLLRWAVLLGAAEREGETYRRRSLDSERFG